MARQLFLCLCLVLTVITHASGLPGGLDAGHRAQLSEKRAKSFLGLLSVPVRASTGTNNKRFLFTSSTLYEECYVEGCVFEEVREAKGNTRTARRYWMYYQKYKQIYGI